MDNGANTRGGGVRWAMVPLLVLMIFGRACGPAPEASTPRRSLEELKERYPRIPANGIRIPPASDLRNPDFDVGGHCLAEERAGRGSLEDCLEVVGRELLAIGGPDQR